MSQLRLTLKFSWFHVIIFLVGPVFFFFFNGTDNSFLCNLIVGFCFVLFLTLSCLLYKQSGSNFTILRLVLWVNMFSSHCRSLSWGQWFIRYTVARGSVFKSATYTSPFWGNALGLCLALIYVLKPCSFAAFGGIFMVKSAAAVEQWGSLVNEVVSKLVLGFLVLRKCWGWGGGVGIAAALVFAVFLLIQKITAVLLFASGGTMYGFFLLVKMWCLSLLPNPNWAHLSAFLLAPHGRWSHHSHQIVLPSIHTISSILWSFKVWDCEPEWGEPPFGVLSDPGAWTWGRTTRGRKVWQCGCCALWSGMHGSPAQVPLRGQLRGAGGGSLFSFDWHHL